MLWNGKRRKLGIHKGNHRFFCHAVVVQVVYKGVLFAVPPCVGVMHYLKDSICFLDVQYVLKR